MTAENEATNGDEKNGARKKNSPPTLSFELKTLHTKALLTLLRCHHSDVVLTYPELSREIGVGEKTKSWQCEAWKELKGGKFIVPGKEKGTVVLSPEGIELAESQASDEELAEYKTPMSNEELHEKIRKRLTKGKQANGKKHCGKEIFDLFLTAGNDDHRQQQKSFLRLELAAKLGINPDSHSFFYGFQALQKMGLVSEAGKATKEELLDRYGLVSKSEDGTNGKKVKKIEVEDGREDLEKLKDGSSDKKVEKIKIEIEKEDLEKPKEGTSDKKVEKIKIEIGIEDLEKFKDGTSGKKVKKLKIEDGQEKFQKPKKKPRIRGGPQLYQLSEKAYLVTAKDA